MSRLPGCLPSRLSVRDVAEHIAFETPFSAAEIMIGAQRTVYMRELRVAVIWCAQKLTNRTTNALAQAFGKSRWIAADMLARAEFLREWDPEFCRLTDLVVASLIDAAWPDGRFRTFGNNRVGRLLDGVQHEGMPS